MDEPIDSSPPPEPDAVAVPAGVVVRQASPEDAEALEQLLKPFVKQRLLLARSVAELIELTRHGFVAHRQSEAADDQLIGFAAIEIYSPKLAELQCLAVDANFQGSGVGRSLVAHCVKRAKDLNVMEVLAISSSERFLQSCGFDYALPDQKKALFCQLRPRPAE